MNSFKQPDQVFTIQQISQKLNIPKPTLRFWEKEMDGIFVPFRTKGGQRRYNAEHIYIIDRIKGLREEGKSITEIKAILWKNHNGGKDNMNRENIDILSDRITEIVRMEINRFFQIKGWN